MSLGKPKIMFWPTYNNYGLGGGVSGSIPPDGTNNPDGNNFNFIYPRNSEYANALSGQATWIDNSKNYFYKRRRRLGYVGGDENQIGNDVWESIRNLSRSDYTAFLGTQGSSLFIRREIRPSYVDQNAPGAHLGISHEFSMNREYSGLTKAVGVTALPQSSGTSPGFDIHRAFIKFKKTNLGLFAPGESDTVSDLQALDFKPNNLQINICSFPYFVNEFPTSSPEGGRIFASNPGKFIIVKATQVESGSTVPTSSEANSFANVEMDVNNNMTAYSSPFEVSSSKSVSSIIYNGDAGTIITPANNELVDLSPPEALAPNVSFHEIPLNVQAIQDFNANGEINCAIVDYNFDYSNQRPSSSDAPTVLYAYWGRHLNLVSSQFKNSKYFMGKYLAPYLSSESQGVDILPFKGTLKINNGTLKINNNSSTFLGRHSSLFKHTQTFKFPDFWGVPTSSTGTYGADNPNNTERSASQSQIDPDPFSAFKVGINHPSSSVFYAGHPMQE